MSIITEKVLNQSHLFVVIKYSVHVLNPDGIHGTIKQDPLAVFIGVAGILSECVGQHAVCPLVGDGVKAAVQLSHGDGLWVDDAVDRLELWVELGRAQVREAVCEDLPRLSLPAQRVTHHHQAVTHQDHLINLVKAVTTYHLPIYREVISSNLFINYQYMEIW